MAETFCEWNLPKFASRCYLIYNNSVADVFLYPKLPFYYLSENNRNHIPHVMKVPDDVSLCPERVACEHRLILKAGNPSGRLLESGLCQSDECEAS